MNWNGFILYCLGMVAGTAMVRDQWLLFCIASVAAGRFDGLAFPHHSRSVDVAAAREALRPVQNRQPATCSM